MKKPPILYLALWACLWHIPASAQSEAEWPSYFQLSGHLQAGFPMEGFAGKQNKDGVGFGGQMLFQLKRGMPLFAGLDAGMLYLDQEKLKFTAIEDGQSVDYRRVTHNNIFMAHGLLRFKPFTNGLAQPYADGLAGVKKLYTRTRLIDESQNEDNIVESDTDLSDSAFSYGLGAGVQVYLSEFPTILGDLRVTYLPGENATYYTRSQEAPDPIEDPLDVFEEVSSPTALLLIQLGVTLQLSSRDFEKRAIPDDGD
ncbi:MAG: outer membrane beta-barrel protein [Lewinellaceae bacterium]|nr:outer membrane beta-barrel protein [Phaeodactylibacter sp.]MCB9346570.1 outer membrane beta-barrel protein [Lewinellaceae bacterium]